MDGSRFDAWTRRRFGVAMAGALALLFGLEASQEADARRKRRAVRQRKRKRRKRKRKCEKPRTRCNPQNDKQLCCPGHACQIVPELGGHRCCHMRFDPCRDNADCCGNLLCTPAGLCDTTVQ